MEIMSISWQQTIPLRHRVLWPNKTEEYCYVKDDQDGFHYGAFIDKKLVCVASIYIVGNSARLRKFATDKNYQNLGIGSKMITHIIQVLTDNSVNHFWLDARESATEFYKRFGMIINSDRFFKGNVPYIKMKVDL